MNYVNDKFQRSFEIVAERFLSKIGFGELIVTFPSGSTKSFKGTNGDEIADLKLHNYKFIRPVCSELFDLLFADAKTLPGVPQLQKNLPMQKVPHALRRSEEPGLKGRSQQFLAIRNPRPMFSKTFFSDEPDLSTLL